jgi:hypothetical protein
MPEHIPLTLSPYHGHVYELREHQHSPLEVLNAENFIHCPEGFLVKAINEKAERERLLPGLLPNLSSGK